MSITSTTSKSDEKKTDSVVSQMSLKIDKSFPKNVEVLPDDSGSLPGIYVSALVVGIQKYTPDQQGKERTQVTLVCPPSSGISYLCSPEDLSIIGSDEPIALFTRVKVVFQVGQYGLTCLGHYPDDIKRDHIEVIGYPTNCSRYKNSSTNLVKTNVEVVVGGPNSLSLDVTGRSGFFQTFVDSSADFGSKELPPVELNPDLIGKRTRISPLKYLRTSKWFGFSII